MHGFIQVGDQVVTPSGRAGEIVELVPDCEGRTKAIYVRLEPFSATFAGDDEPTTLESVEVRLRPRDVVSR